MLAPWLLLGWEGEEVGKGGPHQVCKQIEAYAMRHLGIMCSVNYSCIMCCVCNLIIPRLFSCVCLKLHCAVLCERLITFTSTVMRVATWLGC